VDSVLKRGLKPAVGRGGRTQEETNSARSDRACGLFADQLPTRQPEQPRFRI